MFSLIGTVLFGVGTSLNAKVIVDKLVYGKSDPLHLRMSLLGFTFMLIGEGLKSIERSVKEASMEEV